MKITVELTAEQWAEILHLAESFYDLFAEDGSGYKSAEARDAVMALYEELSKKGIPGW